MKALGTAVGEVAAEVLKKSVGNALAVSYFPLFLSAALTGMSGPKIAPCFFGAWPPSKSAFVGEDGHLSLCCVPAHDFAADPDPDSDRGEPADPGPGGATFPPGKDVRRRRRSTIPSSTAPSRSNATANGLKPSSPCTKPTRFWRR